jgi:hypothetical protein
MGLGVLTSFTTSNGASGLMADGRQEFIAQLLHGEPCLCRIEPIQILAVIAEFAARLGQAFGFKAAFELLAVQSNHGIVSPADWILIETLPHPAKGRPRRRNPFLYERVFRAPSLRVTNYI